jgi:beta-lactamase regulating signal transducer with metallopeptidase domain
MKDVLIAVFNITVTGSFLFLLGQALRPITKRLFSNQWQYIYLKCTMVLFVVPLFSITAFLFPQAVISVSEMAGKNLDLSAILPYAKEANFVGENALLNGHSVGRFQPSIWAVGGILWLAGVLTSAALFCRKNHRFYKAIAASSTEIFDKKLLAAFKHAKYAMGITTNIGLYRSTFVSTPMLVGLVKPKIILPDREYEESSLDFIFRHELSHSRSHDIGVKLVVSFVCILHWFNPLSYAFAALLEQYQELACDETVVQYTNKEALKTYASIVLEAFSPPRGLYGSVASFAGSKNHVKRRLVSIMNPKQTSKKKRIWGVAILALVFVLSTVGLFTVFASANAPKKAPVEAEKATQNPVDPIAQTEEDIIPANVDTPVFFAVPITGTEVLEYTNPAPSHKGVDFLAPEGTAVLASADGTVSKVVTDGYFGYGNYLIVDHGNGYQTLYGHNNDILVSEGDTVAQGERIAEVGRSGNATDYMLHFEILNVDDSLDIHLMMQDQK